MDVCRVSMQCRVMQRIMHVDALLCYGVSCDLCMRACLSVVSVFIDVTCVFMYVCNACSATLCKARVHAWMCASMYVCSRCSICYVYVSCSACKCVLCMHVRRVIYAAYACRVVYVCSACVHASV